MAEIATKLLAPKVEGSIYVEDGELEETSFIHCKTLDCDGRRVEDDFGFFKVTPDMFQVEERITYDKTKTYLNYYLTAEGLDKLKAQGCPGYVVFDVVSRSQVKEKLNNTIVHAAALVKEQARLETLLNEDT